MKAALLRIFSGVHVGAEITLAAGDWVIGRDESCDIVLSDASLAPRHAVLRVGESSVAYEKLDGDVLAAAGDALPGAEIPPGKLCRMGDVLFAWAAEGASETIWDDAKALLKGAAARASAKSDEPAEAKPAYQTADERSGEEKASAGASEAAGVAKAPAADADHSSENSAQTQKEHAGQKPVAAFSLALVILAGAILLSLGNSTSRESIARWLESQGATQAAESVRTLFAGKTEQEKAKSLEAFGTELAARGFKNVKVSAAGNGFIRVTGAVRDDKERAALLELARARPEPVMLDLRVASDYTGSLRAAFNAEGIWPEVTLRQSPEGEALLVAAYIEDAAEERRVFRAVEDMRPVDEAGNPLPMERRIRHSGDVQKALAAVLKTDGLERKVEVQYLPGVIRLTAADAQAAGDLDRAAAALAAAMDVPLKFEFGISAAAPKPQQTAARPAKAEPLPQKAAEKGGPEFEVTAVSGGALRFVTLSTGEKVFPGGRLPGGYTLESIEQNRLVLSKDKQIIHYQLRLRK